MSQCDKQQMHQHAPAHHGLCQHMQHGCNRVCQCSRNFFGPQSHQQFGPICNQGMNGAYAFAGNSGFGNGFDGLYNGFGNNFGNGLPYQNSSNMSIAIAISGANMRY
jgi:hypothetical protein